MSFKIDGKCVSNRWKESFKTGRSRVKKQVEGEVKNRCRAKFKIGGQ